MQLGNLWKLVFLDWQSFNRRKIIAINTLGDEFLTSDPWTAQLACNVRCLFCHGDPGPCSLKLLFSRDERML